MSGKKLTLLIGACLIIAGCSSQGNYSGYELQGTASEKGVRYLLGRGVRRDNQKAFYYFKQAANKNDPFAQNELAFMYAAGKGTARDYAKALKYYEKAANHGLASAQYNLGMMYIQGLGAPRNKVLAIQWFKKSATHGFEPAKVALDQYSR